jgi:AcrR family transcriptional regulator
VTARPREPLIKAPAEEEPADGRRARGMRSRAAVLDRSVQLASREGLEGLTIGRLATELELHKSSVFALFGSKEELQLATLAAARGILIDQVIVPALTSEEGLPRLQAIGEAWCDYFVAEVFEGGCFLCAASAEMDGRPGPVRDAVEVVMREWIAVLSANIDAAIAAGDLRADVDPAAMAFRLNALGMAANWERQLLEDPAGIEHARAGWRAEIDAHRSRPPRG